MLVTNIYKTLHGGDSGAIGSKPPGGTSVKIDDRSIKKANELKEKQKKGGCKC